MEFVEAQIVYQHHDHVRPLDARSAGRGRHRRFPHPATTRMSPRITLILGNGRGRRMHRWMLIMRGLLPLSAAFMALPMLLTGAVRQDRPSVLLHPDAPEFPDAGPRAGDRPARIERGHDRHRLRMVRAGYAQRDAGLTEIKGDFFLKSLERDPRYIAFLKKMRFPV